MQAAETAAVETMEWSEQDAGRLGVWLFILSEILLFGAFFASYVSTRLGSSECALGVTAWPEAGHMPGLALAALNTVILLTSSFTMVRAGARARRGDSKGLRRNLALTLALGAGFLAVKTIEYGLKISLGYYPGSAIAAASAGLSIFLSYYYAMTILHALHIAAGLAWIGTLLWKAQGARPAELARKAEIAGLYWHFVDVVWVFLFPLLYLI
ncbi:MAG TPA: cytochrome c oxidase subunit 3 [Elusimicrobiota bacterium]|jgi:cytochrome c oxidase subunit 3|nr:cytochrome c oxidase subunit 3 [Elusimicrobiota bacterium]